MLDRGEIQAPSFNALRISIASPEQIINWSHGEVTKPETINYRTLRAEKDGLFCERIFGPTKDWECFCGKYKRIRYRGVVCDRCGVEVTRSKVRRERMGHIDLAAPVAHIWFSKGTPSRLGILLDLSPRNLERVLYFAQHIVISVDEEAREQAHEDEKNRYAQEKERRLRECEEAIDTLSKGLEPSDKTENDESGIGAEIARITAEFEDKQHELEIELQATLDQLEDLRPLKLLTESRYRELSERYSSVFHSGMGAEAVLEILQNTKMDQLWEKLMGEMHSTSGQRRKKAIKRLRVVDAFQKGNSKPEWMVLTSLPILPPELRPMVQLDGGRFATSDLNDLYRRVINRNNRLKRLLELGAPEIIVRNEKRMLQESVDALVDNGRRGRPIQGSHNHKLKSLSDLLRGKQGRFRQNLLGKRVDYSGRSVIVVGPELELHQCGLPKRMALELFKPFVMHRLVLLGLTPNIKSAKRIVERAQPEVWGILEEVIKRRPVLLNRAPTLHRLGLQAFQPVLIEGNAIQIHPLVCGAFNADFDGDQMAVHVPLSRMAVQEANRIMLSVNNMLSPASGEPLSAPTMDIVMGCYYLTLAKRGAKGEGDKFLNGDEAKMAYDAGHVELQSEISIRDSEEADGSYGWLSTTVGRLIFNEVIPPELGYKNEVMTKNALKDLTAEGHRVLGNKKTAALLDRVKRLGFHYATSAGITVGMVDIQVSKKKGKVIAKATKEVDDLKEQYSDGLITEEERYSKAVSIWTGASDAIGELVAEDMPKYGGFSLMAQSGTKGNISQIKQMAGMRGLMSNPKGQIIDLPIKSSFREGLSALEYFISTHGARKGLADTALRTADSGYLTRRLVDVCQDVIVLAEDCGTEAGIELQAMSDEPLMAPLKERIQGRLAASPVLHVTTGEILVDRNGVIDGAKAQQIVEAGVTKVNVRSPLVCDTKRGICGSCYGVLPATDKMVIRGEAVGIMAAQSIGEPGTQLTMRTFHTGGVAGIDITSGLPRVEELFEARVPKGTALLADIDGEVIIEEQDDMRRLRISSKEEYRENYPISARLKLLVKEGEKVKVGDVLARRSTKTKSSKKENGSGEVTAEMDGTVEIGKKQGKKQVSVVWEDEEVREYPPIPLSIHIQVEHGAKVKAGQALTSGNLNPHDILKIKGKEDVEQYLISEVQKVYRSQGVGIHNKHIEIIVRQMLRRVQVDSPGDTGFIPGEYSDRFEFQKKNDQILAEGGEPATAKPVLLGVTRASLLTDSFLAAASFQETTRVLSEASVRTSFDNLLGLKENVIIGRLVPARFDMTEEGKERLGVREIELEEEAKQLAALKAQQSFESGLEEVSSTGDSFEEAMKKGL